MMQVHFSTGSSDMASRQSETATDPKRHRAGPPVLLVVEDDWLIASEIEAALVDAGFVVPATAGSAEEAIVLAGLHRPHLVLMDIRLEGERDGIEAATEILGRFDIRSLYISANSDPRTRLRAEATRPHGWLPKPFSESQLIAAVRRALAEE